ncbi:MAG: hypothetical protein IPP76_01395 [Moraxellaceae bacterium]|nr:hypothetical protein [Moraxellaceae bacterium]
MGLKQIVAEKTKSCVVAPPRQRNAQLLDDLDQNTRNSQRNTSATTSLKALANKDYTRNQQRNYDATVQKTDAQLLPLKTPQKLRSKNEELRDNLPTLSACISGDNSVNSANSISNEATKTHYENIVVSEVSTNSENLAHPPMEDGQHSPTVEVTPLNFMERNALLVQSEKPLFYHALNCPYCHIEKAQYCLHGNKQGKAYNEALLLFEDAQARREDLALRIDRACISGRSVFEAFNPANVQQLPNTALQTRKYGNTHEYEMFINHWTACEVCKPNLGRYCTEGVKLKVVADNSYS